MSNTMLEDGRKNIVGGKIRSLRQELGLSQEKLAARLQVNGMDLERGVIKRIENGTRTVSDYEIKAFADFFNVSYQELLDDSAQPME